MTWIKICGTTNLEDAQLSIAAGADALGFIFAESPRRIDASQAKKIISRLPGKIEMVGVFVNEAPHQVARVAEEVGLTAVQLHGDEPAQHVGLLAQIPNMKVLRAVSVHEDKEMQVANRMEDLYALVFDNGNSTVRGGRGKPFNWLKEQVRIHKLAGSEGDKLAADNAATLERMGLKVIVAGGLTPQNVAEAIQTLHPWGVDVVSGVERSPGRKDPEKLKAFVRAVREADTNHGKKS